MAPSLHVRTLVAADLDDAEELRRIAGWNQRLCDWQRLLDHEPRGCFVTEIEGRIAGTVTTTTYGTELAWIGMMLVHPDFRRRGIATALMERSLEYLRDLGVGCIKLDATPAGQPVYERLGFRDEWAFHRWEGPVAALPLTGRKPDHPGFGSGRGDVLEPADGVERLDNEFLRLDREAFGVDRSPWLRRLARESIVVEDGIGRGMCRGGEIAGYLGPVVTDDPEGARRMVLRLLSSETIRRGPADDGQASRLERVFWDIPGPNLAGIELARSLGFQQVRPLLRMWTGDMLVAGRPELQYALADPGTG